MQPVLVQNMTRIMRKGKLIFLMIRKELLQRNITDANDYCCIHFSNFISIKQEPTKRPKEISLADTPIMFDLMTPDEGGERQLTKSGQEGPPRFVKL